MSDSMPHASDPSRRHVAMYRRLLGLFPSEFRKTYGGLMAQLFHDQCRDARRRAKRKPLAMASLWGQTLLDTGKAAGREHLSNLRKWFRLQPKDPLQNSLMNTPVPSRYHAAKWLILAGTTVGLAVSAFVALNKRNEYRSTSVLMQAPRIMVSGSSGPNGSSVAESREGLSSIDSVLTMMQNDAVIQRVLTRLKAGQAGTNGPVRPALGAQPGAGGTFIITVSSTNFEYARQFATAWAQEFVDFTRQRQRAMVTDAEAKLTQDILVFQKRVDSAQQARDDFQRRYNISTAGAGDSPAQRRLEETKAEYATLRMELRETENVTAEQLAQAAPGNRWFDFRLEEKRAELRLQEAPNDPGLKAEFARRQDDLKALVAVTEEMRVAKIESLKLRSAGYPQRIEELTGSFFDSAAQRVELQRLEDQEKFVHEQLDELSRFQLILKRKGEDVDQFTILSAGGGDSRPVGPNRPYILLVGFTWGGLVGLALALIRARLGGPKDPGTPSSTASLMPAPIGA
ncbi:MAG TPA: hypothetical protein VMB21_07105 [Candidatus Limnocylindria bacterium]|jgi:uncharacterized protein involved in exopolysaccharide biosynthesis|nr:hypothetical protein [Candidatus Limnocylindria bacterium]